MRLLPWSDVVRVLPDDETRSYAATRLRESGFSPDTFASQKKAWGVVTDALTRIEDRLELQRRRRVEIRDVRRRLEREVWP